jgi:ribosomal protein L32
MNSTTSDLAAYVRQHKTVAERLTGRHPRHSVEWFLDNIHFAEFKLNTPSAGGGFIGALGGFTSFLADSSELASLKKDFEEIHPVSFKKWDAARTKAYLKRSRARAKKHRTAQKEFEAKVVGLVDCPYCGAKAGEPCVVPKTGNPAIDTHSKRILKVH